MSLDPYAHVFTNRSTSGNLASSASSTIESTIGERFPLPPLANGTKRYKYGLVICIFMGCVFAYTILITFAGPEYLGRQMDEDTHEDSHHVDHMGIGTDHKGISTDLKEERSSSNDSTRQTV